MKKIVLWLVATLVAFVGLALLFTPWLVGIYAVANDDMLLRETYNNPVIEGGYAGWHEVSAAEGVTFMLPGSWTLSAEGTTLVITDTDGSVIARGHVRKGDLDPAAPDASLSAMAGFPVTGVKYQPVPELVHAHGCEMQRIVLQGEGQQAVCYQLTLKRGGQTVSLCFPNCHGAAFTTLIDQAEAMVFSLLYGTAG